MTDDLASDKTVVLACGANARGLWGEPGETIRRLDRTLATVGIQVLARSPVFKTAPVGPGRQPPYLNLSVLVRTPHGPARLLSILRQIEWLAGRRRRVRWGARPLDLDIIDYKGLRLNWHVRDRSAVRPGRRAALVLPHPLAHTRKFVLAPLRAIAPDWRHPVTRQTAGQLLAHLGHDHGRSIDQAVRANADSPRVALASCR